MQDSSPNPYASPVIESDRPDSTLRLFSPGQIAWATFLGSPLAGCVLLSMNYRRNSNSSAAKKTLAAGAAVTVVLMIVAFLLPDAVPSSALPIGCVFAMHQIAKSLQGDIIEKHLLSGRTKASGWLATGIGFLSVVVILACLFAVLMVLPVDWVE